MVDAQRARSALALRPLPRSDTGVVARLHPRDRLAGRVTGCGQRDRPQPPILEASCDAVDAAGLRLQHPLQERAKRGGIDETPCRRQGRAASRQQPSAPSHGARRQVAQVDAEHLLDAQTGPDVDEVLEVAGKRFLVCCQERRVYPAGRYPRQNVRGQLGKYTSEVAENSNLIGGARTAAGEHKSQIGSFVRNAYQFTLEDRSSHA